MGEEKLKERILLDALQRSDTASADFAVGMTHAFSKHDGEAWVADFLEREDVKRFSNEVISRTLLLMPQSKLIWDHATAFGSEVEHAYWSKINMPGVGKDRETVEFVVEKLLAVGRAIDAATLAAYRGNALPSEIIIKILTEAAGEQLQFHPRLGSTASTPDQCSSEIPRLTAPQIWPSPYP
jgi:hypothetical protein